MKYEIIETTDGLELFKYSENLKTVLNRFVFEKLNIICLDDSGNKIVLVNNKEKYSIFFIDKTVNVFLHLINNQSKTSDISKSYKVITAFDLLKPNLNDYFDLFKIIGWQTGQKGIDYYKFLKKSPEKLRDLILNKKLFINDGFLFNNHFKENYDFILEKIAMFEFSFSENNQIISAFTEYSIKTGKSLEEISNIINWNDKQIVLKKINDLKFPYYSKVKNKFDEYIKPVNEITGVEIVNDKYFEKADYQMIIKFNNLDNLNIKLDVISKRLKDFDKDLFYQKNLFRE